MSKQRGSESPPEPHSSAEAPFSVGQYLQAQRVMRGIEIEELSLRTRIPRRSIERLEAGAFDGEPDGFVRGFVRTVSEGLGLDADDTLVRMLREPEVGRRGAGLGVPPRAWLALAGVLVLLVAVLSAIQLVLSGAPDLEEASADEVVRRRDPVRALAEAQAASPPLMETPAPPVREPEPSPASAQASGLPAVSAQPAPR
jgi:hypothetical protein